MSTKLPQGSRVYIQEVVTRDGFQMEDIFIETGKKIDFINKLSECGFAKIEVTSFTSPKAIPALKDAKEVSNGIDRNPDVVYTALIPNMKGAENAMSCNLDEFNLVMSISESHNQANLRMTREDSVSQLSDVIKYAQANNTAINISFSTVFGCPIEGDIDETFLTSVVERFSILGVNRFTLCDTTGMAYPSQVQRISLKMLELYPEAEFTLHFHNTRGMGLANVVASINAGINRFDSSLGGLGGCPYAPGATGNICTEELVHMLDLMGYDTGIDIDLMVATAKELPALVGHNVPSTILKAGLRTQLSPRP